MSKTTDTGRFIRIQWDEKQRNRKQEHGKQVQRLNSLNHSKLIKSTN